MQGLLADGEYPGGDLTFDQAGNIYGAAGGGADNSGTVYELTRSGSGWTENLLYSLGKSPDGAFPSGVIGDGNIFKLTSSNGSWTYTSLHDFQWDENGAYPNTSVLLDGNGHLYGNTPSAMRGQ